jgi:hypothetical protein
VCPQTHPGICANVSHQQFDLFLEQANELVVQGNVIRHPKNRLCIVALAGELTIFH